VSTREEQKNLSGILNRLCIEGILCKHGNKNGAFRKIDSSCETLDYINAPVEKIDLWLPFNLNKLVNIYPKNIIVVAGSPNAGKTALLLNIVRQNMHKRKIHYFSSEMGSSELRLRLQNFKDLSLKDWSFHPYERASNFADVIRPNDINIIDYMEIHEEHYKIGQWIKDIFDRLDKGIAIIAIQKKPGASAGVGGNTTLEKPRLYLTMEGNKIKIEKAKSFAQSHINPNGAELSFKLVDGCNFIVTEPWNKDGIKLEI
jgi:hypothetical protein